MLRVVDAMKSLVRRRPELQTRVTGDPLQGAVHGDGAPGIQRVAQSFDLLWSQYALPTEPDRIEASFERMERDASDRLAIFERPDLGGCPRSPETRHPPEAEPRPRLRSVVPDLPRLFRDSFGFLFDECGVSVDPSVGPVLDLDDLDAWWPDGDDVDLVGLTAVRRREGEVRQQEPLAVALARSEIRRPLSRSRALRSLSLTAGPHGK